MHSAFFALVAGFTLLYLPFLSFPYKPTVLGVFELFSVPHVINVRYQELVSLYLPLHYTTLHYTSLAPTRTR